MPMQWKTIAPIVGRSPSQCLERYEKLIAAGIDDTPSNKRKRRDYDKVRRVRQSKFPTTVEEFEGETRVDKESEEQEKIEEGVSDRIAFKKAEEEVRLQSLLRNRSNVLQIELPRPLAGSVELIRHSLMRADEDKSSFVPLTDIQQADEIIRKELLSLLEHDNANYPLSDKQKNKGVKRTANGVPIIDDFEQAELNEASSLIEEEAQCLRRAMGHKEDSLDEFVETRRTCLNDLMNFPTRSAYGLSTIAGTAAEKLSALQNEFEHVKMKIDDDNKKAQRSERKIDIRTDGNKAREAKLREQIELTFNQMNTAGIELDCFLALQRQEKAAALLRMKGLWEEVQKQKELETSLQKRYGDVVAELERIQVLMEQYKIQAQQLEELKAKKQAEEDEAKKQTEEAEANKQTEELASEVLNTVEVPKPVSMMMDVGI
ncbi:cell division cycle 5-like protein isoform X2 [Silene latifolia]